MKDRILARLFTRFPVLVHGWAKSRRFVVNVDTPWAPLSKPLRECRVALATTAGVHLRSQIAFNMEDKERVTPLFGRFRQTHVLPT
jgi:D-proline reductase (dithiol) PrdB